MRRSVPPHGWGLRPHRLGALDNSCYLPLSRRTYYQELRDHGYHVGCVGKLDLSKPDPVNGSEGRRPLTYAWGFTHPNECEGKMHAGRGVALRSLLKPRFSLHFHEEAPRYGPNQ